MCIEPDYLNDTRKEQAMLHNALQTKWQSIHESIGNGDDELETWKRHMQETHGT